MPSCVVTDNWASAKHLFPHDEIVASISDVLDLPDGTAVKIYQVRSGRILDGPCHTARHLIKRGKLLEVD